ncbi:uncharacterized protein LOC111278821 [Durio zibethinus]|uniref:Uncharacterized protein LOC111278821 n=1 Tax=Durio zibethinus TaxID=66656 RepID=A0A6P5WYL3_DURZI|nr:uncharacterized protein LOC111278821 [Durio zibethinus]
MKQLYQSAINKGESYLVTATVVDIRTGYGWWYASCGGICRKRVVPTESSMLCPNCNKLVQCPQPRFRVYVDVEDLNGSATFLLFDDVVSNFLKVTAGELVSSQSNENTDDYVLPPVLSNLIGSSFDFELRAGCQKNYGDLKHFVVSGMSGITIASTNLKKIEASVSNSLIDGSTIKHAGKGEGFEIKYTSKEMADPQLLDVDVVEQRVAKKRKKGVVDMATSDDSLTSNGVDMNDR